MRTGRIFALAVGIAFAAAACGGSGGSTTKPAAGSDGTTISVAQVPGVGNVYTDANGMALYTPEQEADGTIACTGSCTSIWIPLKPPASGSPTKAPQVQGTIGVIDRPDGTSQVTLDGAPLYRFVQDTAARTVNGNGVTDMFDGHTFTWHVDASGDVSSNTASGSGSNGYNY
jgi:predicted lipoprotein with Yx(FWY)xxD motif